MNKITINFIRDIQDENFHPMNEISMRIKKFHLHQVHYNEKSFLIQMNFDLEFQEIFWTVLQKRSDLKKIHFFEFNH